MALNLFSPGRGIDLPLAGDLHVGCRRCATSRQRSGSTFGSGVNMANGRLAN